MAYQIRANLNRIQINLLVIHSTPGLQRVDRQKPVSRGCIENSEPSHSSADRHSRNTRIVSRWLGTLLEYTLLPTVCLASPLANELWIVLFKLSISVSVLSFRLCHRPRTVFHFCVIVVFILFVTAHWRCSVLLFSRQLCVYGEYGLNFDLLHFCCALRALGQLIYLTGVCWTQPVRCILYYREGRIFATRNFLSSVYCGVKTGHSSLKYINCYNLKSFTCQLA